MSGLSGRERALLLLVLPLVLLLAGWRFGWVPLEILRASREAEIATWSPVIKAAGVYAD